MEKRQVLFPAGTSVSGSHYRKASTCREQGACTELKFIFQAVFSDENAATITTIPKHHDNGCTNIVLNIS